MAAIVATPDAVTGRILVEVTGIPPGYTKATIYRTVDGETSTLADGVYVIEGRAAAVDYSAPPGWAVSYSGFITSPRGANLGSDTGFESGVFTTPPWNSQGLSRHVRADGSAHDGDYYLRSTVAGAGLVSAPAAAMIPGYIGVSNFDSATPIAFVDGADGSFMRVSGPTVAGTPGLVMLYRTFLPYTNGTTLLVKTVLRTTTSTRHASPFVRVTTRYYSATGTHLGFWQTPIVSGTTVGQFTTYTTAVDAKTYTGATQVRLEFELNYGGGIGEPEGWADTDFLDLAYFQAWSSTAQVPTAYSRVYQEVPISPWTTYRAEIWARKPGVLPSASHVSVDVGFLNAAGSPVGTAVSGAITPLRAQWDLFGSSTAASPSDAATARVSLRAYGSAAGADPSMGSRWDADDLYVTDLKPLEVQLDAVAATLPARYVGDAWLRDPANHDADMRVMVAEQPSLERAGRLGVHQVIGRPRPVIVSDVRSGATGSVQLLTRDGDERAELLKLLAPGNMLLFQATPEALLPADMYLMVDGATEERVSRLVTEQWRRHTLEFTLVDPPEFEAGPASNIYQTVASYGVNYDYVLARRGSYLDLLTNTFDPAGQGAQNAVRV